MKKKFTFGKVLMGCAAFLVCLSAGFLTKENTITANAYYYESVTQLQQTNPAKNSITATWNPAENAVSYNVYIGENYGELQMKGTVRGTSYTFSGLKPGVEYRVKVIPVSGKGENGSTALESMVTLADKVPGLRQDRWYYFSKQLNIKWDSLTGADGYTVTLYNSKGKKVKTNSYTYGLANNTYFTKMKDEVYTVKITAYQKINGVTYHSAVSQIQCFNQARVKSCKVSKNKLTIKWGKVGGATGYDIYVSDKPKKGYKKVKSLGANKTSCSLSKVKRKKVSSKKRYYVYVVTKKKNGKTVNTSGALYFWNSKDTRFGYLD